jgi:hypothetical protein
VVSGPVYVVHPSEKAFPGISEWISDVKSVVADDAAWDPFPIRWLPMADDNSFRVTDVLSRVGAELGPVLVFAVAQSIPRQQTRQKLARRTVVKTTTSGDSTQLWNDLCEIRDLFASGQPHLPRRLVATMLIVRKLHRHKYWGGGNEKNFLWGDEIANGRGVSPAFKDIAQEIANFLRLKEILIVKYGGKGTKGQKYALNPSRIDDITALANDGTASDPTIEQWFFKDNNLVSARDLDGWAPI